MRAAIGKRNFNTLGISNLNLSQRPFKSIDITFPTESKSLIFRLSMSIVQFGTNIVFICECFIHISFCFMVEASILIGMEDPIT